MDAVKVSWYRASPAIVGRLMSLPVPHFLTHLVFIYFLSLRVISIKQKIYQQLLERQGRLLSAQFILKLYEDSNSFRVKHIHDSFILIISI